MAAERDLDDDNTSIDRDDNAISGDEMPYAKLMEMLKGDDEPGDDVAFGQTSDAAAAPEVDTVSIEDGIDLIDKAQSGKREASKVEAAPAEKSADTPADDATTDTATQDSKPAAAPDDLDAILTGLPDAAREAVRTRISAADEVLSAFKGREADLERFGTSPAKAVGDLLKIEAYSRAKPDEYLAWAAGQLGGDPVATITKAAERLGLKVTASSSADDDPFEDPEVKRMRQELAAYKARDTAPQLGPDAPQNRAASDLEAFRSASPHFDAVAPYIAAQASAHAQATGKPVTVADLKRFYDANVAALGLSAPAETTSAAQVTQTVAQQTQTTPAAPSDSVKRAMAASKSLDGSGHGAGRRPALAADAPLSDVLSHFYRQQSGG